MQFIQDFTGFTQYFKDLTARTQYFKFFETGGTEKIVSERLLFDVRSRVNYPLFFLEWPFIKMDDFGTSNTQVNFKSAFVVLEDPQKDDWHAQDLAMKTTLDAVWQVLNQMTIDTAGLNKKFLSFDLSKVNVDPIDNLLIDSAFGWRCEFEVSNPVNISSSPFCKDLSFWKA